MPDSIGTIATLGHSQPRGVHLVGSVPLSGAEEVFRTASAILGERLRRLPDGETGDRTNRFGWQIHVLLLIPSSNFSHESPGRTPRVRRSRCAHRLSPASWSSTISGMPTFALAS